MRWVVIILIIAVSAALGWYLARQTSAQKFLIVPVQSWLFGGDEPDSEDAPNETGAVDEVAEDTAPEVPEPEAPPAADPEPAPDPDPTPDPVPPAALEGDAALDQYRAWISEARTLHPYPDSETRMFDVMMCESGGNADIVNPAGPYTGLFQYANGTWNGEWNTYRDSEITDGRAQIFATALAWSLNMQSQWGCYTRAH